MKALVISQMYPNSSNNVIGIFVHKQVQKLIESGCEVKVVSPIPFVPFFLKVNPKWKEYSSIPKMEIRDGVEVHYPRYVQIPKGYFMEHYGWLMHLGIKKCIKKINDKFDFDIIHAHAVLPTGHSALCINKKYKVPLVLTIHGQDLQGTINRSEKCKNKVYRTLNKVDKIVVVSNKLKSIIKNERFADKIAVINNGINPEEYKLDIKQNVVEKEFTILSVSSLIKSKGIDINIKAISILKKKYPDLKYCIVGDGEERDNLKRLVAELKVEENVFFTGRLPHEEAVQYMNKASIMSLPSWMEGFGIVYIEAMACGKPVVAVRGQGIEDVIVESENGFLVNPHSVEDVVSILDYLLTNPDKAKEVGAKAKECVTNNYTWLCNARKTIQLYNEMLEK